MNDLIISGSTYSIPCMCNRYDQENYSVIVETLLNKEQLKILRDNIRPGATSELYTILGKPRYIDKSWSNANTIRLVMNTDSFSTMKNNRNDKVLFVRNINTVPLKGDCGLIGVKIEAFISGSSFV